MKAISALRRVLSVGLEWAVLWAALWAIIGVIIGIVDPDSIAPGEGLAAAVVLGSMGFFSGVAFSMLLSVGGRGSAGIEPSLTRATGCGILGSAIVQLAYLGHGDLGLAANIRMALLFSAFGGVVTMAWFAMARPWSRRRSSPQSSS